MRADSRNVPNVDIDRVKEFAKQQGLTMKYLCDCLGKRRGFLTAVRNGRDHVDSTELAIIADRLHTTPEYLTGATDDPSAAPAHASAAPSDAPQAAIPSLLVSVPASPTREYLRLAAAFLADAVDRALAAQKTAATPDDVVAVDVAACVQALPPERLQLLAGCADFLSRFGAGRGDLA